MGAWLHKSGPRGELNWAPLSSAESQSGSGASRPARVPGVDSGKS